MSKLFVGWVIIICSIFIVSCSNSKSSSGSGNTASIFCTDESCVKNVCPAYKAQISSASEKSICKLVGSCELPDMPVTIQTLIPSHGSVACAPTSAQMGLDCLIANTTPTMSDWMDTYSKLSATSTVTGCPSADLDCKKVVTIGSKLINGSWSQSARAVSAGEVTQFIEDIKTDIAPVADTFKTKTFPDNVDACDYMTGDHAIKNGQPWNNILLYLTYEQTIAATSTFSGVPLTDIKFKPSENGHFIIMNGYNTMSTDVLYKFHCPIYGIKWYEMKHVKLNQPFCVVTNATGCAQYVRVTELPQGFENGEAFTYLLETAGEEVAQDYIYKIVASISGIK